MPIFYNKGRYAPYANSVIATMLSRQKSYGNYMYANSNNDRQVTRRVMPKKKSRSLKSKVMNMKAAKHFTGEQGVTMTHNTLYTLTPTAGPTQGDAINNRDGDAIILCALKLKGFYNTDTASNGYSFRVIVGYSGEEVANTTFGAGLGISDLFLPNTGSTVTCNGIINPKAFTVIHDEKLTANSTITGVRDKVDYSITVPLGNRSFMYQSSASALGKDKNLMVVIVSDLVGGTTGITATGGTSISWDFIYKNAS